jgi:P4 family phage/plasmid primase-like protien
MESMFNESALGKRIKWAKRADYRNMSIERAIQDCVGVYTHAPTAKLNLTESLNQINTESALVDNKALKHPWISAFKWTTSSDGVMRIKGINIDTIADLIAPQFAYVDHLIWKKNGRVLTLVHNGDLEREIGMQLKAADARRLMNKETIPKLKLYLASSCEQVEAKSHADKRIAVKNGVLNIVTGELDEDNTDYFTAGLPIEYEPEATCPTIDKFLDESFTSDQKEFILSIFGAVLSGKEVQHILALIGEGRNGKGILEAIIKETFGKTWTNAKADTLDSRFANDAFIGVRIVWQEEVPSSRKGQENLKRISGGATINIEVKNAQGVHPECVQALVVLDTNNPPAFESGSAMDNRLRVVQMPYVFKDEPVAETKNEKKRDPLLKEMVLKELSGFLNKLLPYAKYYYINGRLKHDLAVNRELLDAQSSSLQSFIDKFGEEDEPEIVRNCYGDERTRYVVTRKCDKKTFLKYYELYCKEIGKAMEPSSHIWYLMRNEFKFKIRNTSIQGLSIDKAKKHYVESPLISAKNFKDTRGEIKTKDSG